MPSSSAFFCAPSFIFTKNGLESVLVIRQAPTSAALAAPANAKLKASAPAAEKSSVFFIEESSQRLWPQFRDAALIFEKAGGQSPDRPRLPLYRTIEGWTSQRPDHGHPGLPPHPALG